MKRTCTSCLFLAWTLSITLPAHQASALPSTGGATQPNLPSLPAMPPPPRRAEMPLEFFNFLKDCFQVNLNDGQQQYAAWLPLQAFVRMYAAGGGDTAALEPKVADLKPYLMFIVENRTYDEFKNPVSETAESLRSRATLKFPDGSETRALDKAPEGMPANPPTFGNLGRKGQLLIFPAEHFTDLDGEHSNKGKIELQLKSTDRLKGSTFTWHLPLELAGSTRECSRCHNESSGKWSYCPWCGLRQK